MAAESFNLTITRVDKPLFDDTAESVIVPGIEGEMTLLKGHEALITPLKEGSIRVSKDGSEKTFDIETGMLEVSDDHVSILI